MDADDVISLVAHRVVSAYTVTINVRAVFLLIDQDGIKLLAYYQNPPTERERELMTSAAMEIWNELRVLPEGKRLKTSHAECIFTQAPWTDLDKPGEWLFVRAEELDALEE